MFVRSRPCNSTCFSTAPPLSPLLVNRPTSDNSPSTHLPRMASSTQQSSGTTRYQSESLLQMEEGRECHADLMSKPWVQRLVQEQDMQSVATCGSMLSPDSVLPTDHLFTTLLKAGLIQDMICLYSKPQREFHTLVHLGDNLCGHAGILHGGMTASIVDETLGGLTYMLKRENLVPPGPAFTVHLECDYKKPIPAGATVVCTAKQLSMEGRKAWVTATVKPSPEAEEVYAVGKALFVVPKTVPATVAAAGFQQGGQHDSANGVSSNPSGPGDAAVAESV